MALLIEKRSPSFIKVKKKKVYDIKFKVCVVAGNESSVADTRQICFPSFS